MFKFLQIAVTTLVLSALAQPAWAAESQADSLNRAVLEKMHPLAEKNDMQPLAAEMNTIKPSAGYEAGQDVEEPAYRPEATSYYGEDSIPVDPDPN